jgi:hypothetical protein
MLGYFGRMHVWRALSAMRFAIAMIVAVAMTLAPPINIVAHGTVDSTQTEQARHAALTQTDADHGHSHDDGDAQERLPGHFHGHNSADHSHDTGHAVLIRTPEQVATPGTWHSAEPIRPVPDQRFRLDRPPRALSAA